MPNTAFYAETVSLQQSNLIEASAGTGKTYSIALLSLRLLLEKNIPILYINTFGHNLVLISDEYINNAIDSLKTIGNID